MKIYLKQYLFGTADVSKTGLENIQDYLSVVGKNIRFIWSEGKQYLFINKIQVINKIIKRNQTNKDLM